MAARSILALEYEALQEAPVVRCLEIRQYGATFRLESSESANGFRNLWDLPSSSLWT